MSDSLTLQIAGRRLDKFLGYRIEADLYCADHYFRLDMADPGIAIDAGQRCELHVNGSLALTGIIDRVTDGNDKGGSMISVEGRDLMGLLVDSYVEEFPDLQNITIKDLAERLLADVPYINRKAIRYQSGLAGATAKKTTESASGALTALGIEKTNTHIEPGQTIFEVLKQAAMSRGATFFGLPDGTFVFGRPKTGGQPVFTVVHRTDGAGNNAFRSTRIRDLSRRYSKITIVGQQQGDDAFSAGQINTRATVEDNDVPYYKPFVGVLNDDSQSPEQYARLLLEMQRAEGLQLVYSLRGHAQNGRNFTINELCRVRDSKRNINGTYLIVSRAFELSKKDGHFTELRLGLPGVIL